MKGRKIKNLTREDITIVDYKNLLVKNSACAAHSASSILLFVFLLVFAFAFVSSSSSSVLLVHVHAHVPAPCVAARFMCRLRSAGEGEAVQQDDEQDQGRVDGLPRATGALAPVATHKRKRIRNLVLLNSNSCTRDDRPLYIRRATCHAMSSHTHFVAAAASVFVARSTSSSLPPVSMQIYTSLDSPHLISSRLVRWTAPNVVVVDCCSHTSNTI